MTEIIERPMNSEEIEEREAWAAGEYDRKVAEVNEIRRSAYQLESDPIFFQWQRGKEGMTQELWLEKIAEINERYPDPVKPGE